MSRIVETGDLYFLTSSGQTMVGKTTADDALIRVYCSIDRRGRRIEVPTVRKSDELQLEDKAFVVSKTACINESQEQEAA